MSKKSCEILLSRLEVVASLEKMIAGEAIRMLTLQGYKTNQSQISFREKEKQVTT